MDNKDFQPLQEGSQDVNQLNTSQSEFKIYNPPSVINLFPANQTGIISIDFESRNTSSQANLQCGKSRIPVVIICPLCNHKGQTIITYEMGYGSWLVVFMLFLFCCLLFWVPFRDQSCQDAKHYCRKCKSLVAICEYSICESSELIV